MSKIIAVTGAPGSGKSTVALKLAQEVYSATGKVTLYLSPDTVIPCMGIIFPYAKKEKLHSLGNALKKPDVFQEDIMAEIVTTKFMDNFGYLGYMAGENSYTYPTPTDDKVRDMFKALQSFADYIFIDCDRNREDLISTMAQGYANHLIEVINPDLRSMTFYGKELTPEGSIKVMNILDRDLYLPIKETTAHFKGIDYLLPYSRAVKQQGITGALPQYVKDPEYRRVLNKLAKAVI